MLSLFGTTGAKTSGGAATATIPNHQGDEVSPAHTCCSATVSTECIHSNTYAAKQLEHLYSQSQLHISALKMYFVVSGVTLAYVFAVFCSALTMTKSPSKKRSTQACLLRVRPAGITLDKCQHALGW